MKQAVALGLLALASFVEAQTSVSLVPTKTGWDDNYGVGAPLFYPYDTASSWCSANATGGYTNSNNSNLSLE